MTSKTVGGKPFVGAGRQLLVQGLRDRFDDAEGSQWVHFEAPSGWGKSHVIKALYENLAASQTSPQYWPKSIDTELPRAPADRIRAIEVNRKTLFPTTINRQPFALPEHFWWAVQCSQSDSRIKSQVENFIGVFAVHDAYIRLREAASNDLSTKVKHEASLAIQKVAGMTADQFVETVTKMAEEVVPGLGIGLKVGKEAERRIRGLVSARATETKPHLITYDNTRQLTSDAVELIVGVAKVMPVVVVVEDVQHADESISDMISGILATEQRVMVISTGTAGCLARDTSLNSISSEFRDKFTFFDHETILGESWPPGASFGFLNSDDIAEIVHYHRSEATPHALSEAGRRVRSPLAAELVACEIPDVGQVTEEGWGFPEGVSGELEGLLWRLWNSLDVDTRRSLSCMAAVIPNIISPSVDENRVDPVLAFEAALGVITDLPQHFSSRGFSGRGWVQFESNGLAKFIDYGMANHAASRLRTREALALRHELAEKVTQESELSTQARVYRVQILVALSAVGIIRDSLEVVTQAATAYDNAAKDYPYRYREILEWLERDVDAISPGPRSHHVRRIVHETAANICSNRDFSLATHHMMEAARATIENQDPDRAAYVRLLLRANDLCNINHDKTRAKFSLSLIKDTIQKCPDLLTEELRIQVLLAEYDTQPLKRKDPHLLLRALADVTRIQADGNDSNFCLQQLSAFIENKSKKGKFGSFSRTKVARDSRFAIENFFETLRGGNATISAAVLGCIAQILFYTGSNLYNEARNLWLHSPLEDFYDADSLVTFLLAINEHEGALKAAKQMYYNIKDDVIVLDHEKAQISLLYAIAIVRARSDEEWGYLGQLEKCVAGLIENGDIDDHHRMYIWFLSAEYVGQVADSPRSSSVDLYRIQAILGKHVRNHPTPSAVAKFL